MRVAVFDFDPDSAVSWYRGCGPWSEMSKTYRDQLDVRFYFKDIPWPELAECDALVMVRPYREEHLGIAKCAKWHGLKLWVDYDDDLFALTADNPSRGVYKKSKTKLTIKGLVGMADLVTLSTHCLKRSWQMRKVFGEKKKVEVVLNAFDPRVIGEERIPPTKPKAKSIVWRGLGSHMMDLNHFEEEIVSLAIKYPASIWTFIGSEPWFLDRIPNHRHVSASGLPIYFDLLNTMSHTAAIVPLRDTVFNRCKSNIAAMELSLTGAIPIVPDWDGWEIPGSYRYTNKKGFESCLEAVLSNAEVPQPLGGQADMFFMDYSQSLSAANEHRWDLLRGLL